MSAEAVEQRTELVVGPTDVVVAEKEIDLCIRLVQSLAQRIEPSIHATHDIDAFVTWCCSSRSDRICVERRAPSKSRSVVRGLNSRSFLISSAMRFGVNCFCSSTRI